MLTEPNVGRMVQYKMKKLKLKKLKVYLVTA